MGKQVEETMIHHISKVARDLDLKSIKLQFKKTAKNEPMLLFLDGSKFKKEQDNIYSWNLDKLFPKSKYVKLIENNFNND